MGDAAAELLCTAFKTLGATGVVQKVLPVKIVWLVLCSDKDAGIALADDWCARSTSLLGEQDGFTLRARLAAEDLRTVVSTPGVSNKRLMRALRTILACTDVG